ncbi:hypothetical protein K435DRAFT_803082 [Dendrothele bispora CBS 962.96]|uniref:Uncharacterized protein n=1 Tax=Dendrothele bispora (strain CBS 962.96) TaxID=1314807 RepID=A0A4S8LIR6_DENBC|nr:hypothetical protein K435DRAFT_803082 [Dendrothele bispora CBS 962.96]
MFRIPSPLKRAWRRRGRMPDSRTRDDLEAGGLGAALVELQQILAPPQNGSDDNWFGQIEGRLGTGGPAADDQKELIKGPPDNRAPPAEVLHDTLQLDLDEHVGEVRTTHADELGGPDRDKAHAPTSLHEAHSTDRREIDAGSLVEAGQLRTDTSSNNERNAGDGNGITSTGRREVEQAGSSRNEDSRRERMEEQLDTGEVVGVKQSQMSDKQGGHLSGVQIGGRTTGGRSEDTGQSGGNMVKSVDTRLMGEQSRAEGERTEGKKEGTETGAVAEGGMSKIERYEVDGAKAETRRESWNEAIPSMPAARALGVDEGVNQDMDTEQRVAGGTGEKEDDTGTGGLAEAGALQKEDSVDDGAQTAVTGMLPTTSSRGDEGPKGDKDDGDQITNDQSQGEVERADREGESLDSTDSPEDGSKDNTTHAGSSREGIASGALKTRRDGKERHHQQSPTLLLQQYHGILPTQKQFSLSSSDSVQVESVALVILSLVLENDIEDDTLLHE